MSGNQVDLVDAGPIQMSNGGVYDICVRFDNGVAAPRGALSSLQAHDLELKRAAVSTHSKLAVEL